MVSSRLPNSVLGRIWKLSDVDHDGMLDDEEFALASHLIEVKLEGHVELHGATTALRFRVQRGEPHHPPHNKDRHPPTVELSQRNRGLLIRHWELTGGIPRPLEKQRHWRSAALVWG
ncbi:unnamed protein product [Pleuronectes platessa]|uniref:Uncharacterized protein n=1 Tax=Pleuronectes platessa TaxID=8262 RepID=A0A9N7VPC8_PLEPL|nr:unnamed protein product [Pleuronectes platessa]